MLKVEALSRRYWQYVVVRYYSPNKKYKRMNKRDDCQIAKHQLFDSRVHDTTSHFILPGIAKEVYEIREPPLPAKAEPRKVRDAKEVQIPMRIERGPTDILTALASTVGTDYTAPHYKYHDDPYLIPSSNLTKRSYSLSKEAGRKAAKWVRQQHADLFQHKVATPPIEMFYPDPVINDETEASEELLLNLISQGHLTDAIKAYQLLKNKKKEISRSAKQSLLEAVAYYNETDPVDEELIEERWYRLGVGGREKQKNTWKEHGLAESLFQELEPQDSSAYCAIIRGRAKYYSAEKALNLYYEAKDKGINIDKATITTLLTAIHFVRENADLRWKLVEELLKDLNESGDKPDVGVLNGVLAAISSLGNHRNAKSLALETLAEFKKVGVEPSLASYYFVLIIHCKERGPTDYILNDIMDEIQGKSFTIQHPMDTNFFVSAMDNCRNHLQDLDLAKRLDDLLHTGQNYDLIGDSYKESVYYRHYFALRCNIEPFDVFMDYYNQIVPNIYTPEPAIMEEVLRSLELNGSIGFLPRIWSDMVLFNYTLREGLLTIILQVMANEFPEDPESDVAKKFVEIGKNIYTTVEGQNPERGQSTLWTGKMLGDLLIIYVKGRAYEKASDIVKQLGKGSPNIIGVPSPDALQMFLQSAISEGDAVMCLATVAYANDCGFSEVPKMAEQVSQQVSLDSTQVARLNNIVGFDIRHSETEEKEANAIDKV